MLHAAPVRPARATWFPLVAAALGLLAAAPACFWVAQNVEATPQLHDAALFVHLGCLVLGFGAVLTVDWAALMWAAGRRPLSAVLDAAAGVTVPIWVGYAGLVLSGLLLEPDVAARPTELKLALVLVIGLNGVLAVAVHRLMERSDHWALLAIGGLSAAVSQAGWWGATVIGFANAH